MQDFRLIKLGLTLLEYKDSPNNGPYPAHNRPAKHKL